MIQPPHCRFQERVERSVGLRRQRNLLFPAATWLGVFGSLVAAFRADPGATLNFVDVLFALRPGMAKLHPLVSPHPASLDPRRCVLLLFTRRRPFFLPC